MKRFSTFRSQYAKELKSYVYAPLFYIFVGIFLVATSWLFWREAFLVGEASLQSFFQSTPWVLALLLPALSMRLWSEEKRVGTEEVLVTLPGKLGGVIAAKFAAVYTVFLGALVLSFAIPIALSQVGQLDWGPVWSGYLGLAVLGAFYLALGQAISGQTRNQIVALLVTVVVFMVGMFLGTEVVSQYVGAWADWIASVSPITHMSSFARGTIHLKDLLFFLLGAALFLYLQTLWFTSKRAADHVRPSRRLRRLDVGLGGRPLQGLLVVGIAITVYVAIPPTLRSLDVTEDRLYTLSSVTQDIVSQAEDPITIQIFFSEDVPPRIKALRQDVIQLVESYEHIEDGSITVETITPDDDEETEKQMAAYGIQPVRFNVIVDEKVETLSAYAGIVLTYRDQQEVLSAVGSTETLEYALTAAIQSMTQEETPIIAVLKEKEAESQELLRAGTVRRLEGRFQVEERSWKELAKSDATALVIPGLASVPTKEERYALDQWIMEGKGVAAFVDGFRVNERDLSHEPVKKGIRTLFSPYGIGIREDLVADFAANQEVSIDQQPSAAYPFWPRVTTGLNQEAAITSTLGGVLFPWPSSLTKEVSDTLEYTELARTTLDAHSYEDDRQFLKPDDIQRPGRVEQYTLALQVSGPMQSAFAGKALPKNAKKETFQSSTEKGNVVVVGTERFLIEGVLQAVPENASLLLNTMDVFTQQEELVALRAEGTRQRFIDPLSARERRSLRYGSLVGSLSSMMGLGMLAVVVRRRAARRAEQFYAQQQNA